MVILFTVTTNINYDAGSALSQLEEIMASLKNWDEAFLQKYCISIIDPNKFLTGHNVDISFQYNGTQCVFNNVYIDVWLQDPNIIKIKKPETLEELEIIWNKLRNIQVDLLPNSKTIKAILCRESLSSPCMPDRNYPGAITISGTWTWVYDLQWLPCEIQIKDVTDFQNMQEESQFQIAKFPLTPKEIPAQSPDCVSQINNMITSFNKDVIHTIVFDFKKSKKLILPYNVEFCTDTNSLYKLHYNNRGYFTIPFITNSQIINGQEALNARLGQKWRTGSFEYTFKQLNELTKDNKDATLKSIHQDIQSKKYLKDLKFDLFGIEIPSSSVGTWGLMILLFAQIYLLCHLQALYQDCKSKNKIELNFPWIGVFPYRLSKLTYSCSTVFLPILANIFVAVRTYKLGIMDIYVLTFLSTSIIVSFITYVMTKKVWNLSVVPAGDILGSVNNQ